MPNSPALGLSEGKASRSGRRAGDEPIPGYRLLTPLGEGGVGEVWKCLGPDNVACAIKIVRLSHSGDDFEASPTQRERAAIERIQAIRHPSMIAVQRVEEGDGELFVVTELADRSLWDEFKRHQHRGRAGIPDAVFLPYLLEAAEVLDVLNFQHGLQHLDVTPTNLLLVNGHVKVGDFGFLSSTADGTFDGDPFWSRGCSSKYASPELLGGGVSPGSDQYSLAIVYQELTTGNLPYDGHGFYDALKKRLNWAPNLQGLQDLDWPVVARALSASPAQRFPSCVDFVLALAEFRINPRQQLSRGADVDDCTPEPQWDQRAADRLQAPPEYAGGENNVAPQSIAARTDAVESPSPVHAPALEPPCSETRIVQANEDVPYRAAVESAPSTGVAAKDSSKPLAGFDFLRLLRKTEMTEFWEAQDDAGRKYCVQMLLGLAQEDTLQSRQALGSLDSLRHPCLQEGQFVRDRHGRLAAISLMPKLTLKQRLKRCRRERLAGIPREELVGYLNQAAEALDQLSARYNLSHLGLNPANLALDDERIQIAEFGQIPLLWLPEGKAAAILNRAYAAPELDRPGDSRKADQFSLAIIYAEMLIGKQPKRLRSESEFESFFAPLPDADRRVIEKACDPDPARRFASCLEMMQAIDPPPQCLILAPVSVAGRPAILDVADLEKGLVRSSKPLPSAESFVADLVVWRTGRGAIPSSSASPLAYQSFDRIAEESFPIQATPPSLLKHKFQVILEQLSGKVTERTDYVIGFNVESTAASRKFLRNKPRGLHVVIAVGVPGAEPAVFTNVSVHIEAAIPDGLELEPALLELRGFVLRTIRTVMHEAPERRGDIRWSCDFGVKLYPILPVGRLEEIVEGRVTNLSVNGIGLIVPHRPPTKHVYLRPEGPNDDRAILIEIVRCQALKTGEYLLGAEMAP